MRKRWREKKWLVKGLVMICIVAGSLTGCGASANKMGDTIASEEYIQENAYDEIAYASEAEAEAPSSEAMPNIDTSSTYNRKVIKSGNMRIQ